MELLPKALLLGTATLGTVGLAGRAYDAVVRKRLLPVSIQILVHPTRLTNIVLQKRIHVAIQNHSNWYLKDVHHMNLDKLENLHTTRGKYIKNYWSYVDVGTFSSVDEFKAAVSVANPKTVLTYLDKESEKETTTEFLWKDCKYIYKNEILQ